MKTIVLTCKNGDPIWINIEKIVYVTPEIEEKGNCTCIGFDGGDFAYVKQTPTEIFRKIEEAQK